MGSLNKAMIIGNLGQDPDVRYTQNNTAVANMSVATTDRYKDSNGEWQERTEWHKIVAWGRLAEIAQQYLKKGSKVYFEGSIQTRSWEDKEGQKRYTTEIKAASMQMLDSKGGAGGGAPSSSQQQPMNSAGSSESANNYDTGFDSQDDDLPF